LYYPIKEGGTVKDTRKVISKVYQDFLFQHRIYLIRRMKYGI
jgi:hypothetical protein